MELAATIKAHSVQGYEPSPDHQYQKYSNINLLETVSSDRTREKIYKVATTVAMVVGAILLIGVVAATAVGVLAIPGATPILAALVASLVLIGGTGAYRRVFYEGFENKNLGISFGALPWTIKAEEHRRSAELHESIAKMAQIAREQEPGLTESQSNLLGRVLHWDKVAETSDSKRDDLKREIGLLKEQIARMQNSCRPEELKPLKEKLGLALRELNQVTATEHVAAKVKSAYFRHIIANPTETHAFDEFGTLETDSYLESLQGEVLDLHSIILYTNLDQQKSNWTVRELIDMDSTTIAQEIFSKTIKAA